MWFFGLLQTHIITLGKFSYIPSMLSFLIMNLTLFYVNIFLLLLRYHLIFFFSVNVGNDVNWFSTIKLSFNSWNQPSVTITYLLIYMAAFDLLKIWDFFIHKRYSLLFFLYCPWEVFILRLFWLPKTSWEVFSLLYSLKACM